MNDLDSDSILLQAVDDGLPTRKAGQWAKKKLDVLEYYIAISTVAMKKKPWRRRFYIDLQAGPGKNLVEDTGEILLGSPIIALTQGAGYTDYRFIEQERESADTLWKRCKTTSRLSQGNIIVADCNEAVHQIVDEINRIDAPYIKDQWPSLSLAFFDPDGLELQWETVSALATVNRIDLIINFSTNGVRRAAGQALNLPAGTTQMDRFFGTTEWREIPPEPNGSMPVRGWLDDLYKKRLEDIGFSWGTEISVPINTTYGVELYRLLFASKSKVGIDFWEKARKRGPDQLSLF